MPDVAEGGPSGLAYEIVEADEDGLVAFDERFRFVYVNPAAQRLLGKTAAELQGRAQWEAFPATVGAPLETEYRRAMAEHIAVRFENFHETSGRWLEVHASPSNGGGLMVRFRDITDRKRSEECTRSVALFPEENPSPVLRVGRDGTLLYANRSAEPLLAQWRCAAGQSAPEVVRHTVETALAGGTPQELSVPRGDREISFIVTPIPGRDYANLYGRDVTESRRTEAELRDLAARSRAEEAVRVERQRLHDVLNMLPAYVVLLSPDYHVPFTNRVFRERFGEPRGRRCFEYLFGRTEPCTICETFAVLRTGLPHCWEWTGPDGRNYDIYDFPFPDTDGSPLILEMGIDVTERKQAEEALREAHKVLEVGVQERTAELAQANVQLRNEIDERRKIELALRESQADLNRAQVVAHTGSWRLDVRRNELLWSDETHRMFGVPKGTPLTYETFLTTIHPEDREYVDRMWQAALQGAPYDIEHRILVGGELKWVRERAGLEFDHLGALLGGFGTVQDVTERKRAEERILHQNALLDSINRIFSEALTCETEDELGRRCLAVAEEVTQSRFGFIAELNPEGRLDGIAISDLGWEACRMEEPAAPGKMLLGSRIHGIFGRVILDGNGFYTNDPSSHPDSIGVPEGHPPLKAFLGVPLIHAGKTIGMMAVGNREGGYRAQDLAALEALAVAIVQVFGRRRAERAVRASEERLRQAQKMESIGVLAGGIAHDFNNLLATILGNASLLREEVPEESWEKLGAVIQATEKAADLTRQLLAYAGKGRFLIELLDFGRIVRAMTDLLRATIPKKVKLRLALEPGLPGVEADRGQLQQIVMNLVLNAAEAIGAKETGTVTIAARPQEVPETSPVLDEITRGRLATGKYVCLEVTDTGCGIDPGIRAKIFDPFFTTKFMGRGLGLAAVAGIVQAHRGALQLETAPGQGTTFRVFLPAGMSLPARSRIGRKLELQGTGTLLFVDDEASVRRFARTALERYGYQVVMAKNGREAARLFRQNAERIAAVVLDLTMPVMGGDEAIDLLRSQRADLKVIVMSGYSEAEARRMFAGKGASGFLQKPFTVMRLAEEVKLVLTDAGEAARK